MAGEQDDSGRFDYLFEPLDVDLANAEGIDAPAIDQADADDRRSRAAATRIGIVAVIVAMIAVAVATVLFILQRPNPASRVDAPFPNQSPRGDNDNEDGGLLPGLAGGLPGPL